MTNKKYLAIFALSILASSFLLSNYALAAENNTNANSDYKFREMKGDHKSRGIFGTVSSISGNTITITADNRGNETTKTTYTVDANNATVVRDSAASSVSAITVGEKIMVEGIISGTNVSATKINIGTPKKDDIPQGITQGDGQPILAGTVSAINGTTLTITNKNNVTYTVNAASAKIQKQGSSSPIISDVKIGDEIIVQGAVNGTNITATSIIDNGSKATTDNQKDNGPRGFFGGIMNFLKNIFGF